ncbi:hypothetical protein LEP1GSC137_0378 [Leptospira borgpetersenii str. Noumea 25]|uniref:Uncharacterized protein n=1 Tax=Leptospira borgpetersenii str. Brem 328 TaxID=1049780 RepID=A0ABC9SG41_LEPBO|nr:hypothetical protein LEP1GSC055_0177 [Leptospira borgpetersenii str. Brem 307]EMN16707.1 hypothetical protein LEP1GSC056_0100 [Leptospira borgpetersenii str. Brem 328]EMO11752.1 hypothetical protein LEP1GSC137_0378 [Leptospira borgpetersenii str. Noumea 25]
MLHHEFRMQFTKTKKRTKTNCFSKKSILSSKSRSSYIPRFWDRLLEFFLPIET